MADPVSGVLTRDELKALADAPYGEAAKIIRKHDPLWGVGQGVKIKWRVEFQRDATEYGYAIVEAETEDGANEIADDLKPSDIIWDDTQAVTGWEVVGVEPQK